MGGASRFIQLGEGGQGERLSPWCLSPKIGVRFLLRRICGLGYYFLLGSIPNGADPMVEIVSLFLGSGHAFTKFGAFWANGVRLVQNHQLQPSRIVGGMQY